MKKYFIKTFGCQMNTSDSERIASFLENQNFVLADTIENADLAIFNTCGIKQTAENRAYSMIHNLRKARKENVQIIMTGCLANRSDVQRRMQKSVDLFTEIKNFPQDISNIFSQTKNTFSQEAIDYLSINPKYNNDFTAYVPIMTGCNNFCAYCVVPYARGREVSRSADEIITEVKGLISKGFKNIVILGQNVNSYKNPEDKSKIQNFPELLDKLNKLPGNFWLSYVSSHPKDMSDELIEVTAKSKKICEWIHLPVQAGNDEVLRRMNRRYTQKHYLGLIKKIRTAFKKYKSEIPFSITSDLIVGFPGETRQQFADSETIMKKSKFDLVFFGQFSPRPGTVAWKMKDDVSQKEKARREFVLNEILAKTTLANNKKYVGKKIEVLVEKEKNGFFFGKTRTQKNVKIITSKEIHVGEFVKVQITKANIWNLEGKK